MDEEEDEDDQVMPRKDKSKIILGEYPGEINRAKEVNSIMRDPTDRLLVPLTDPYSKCYLKPGKKEDQDFKIVD